MSTVLPDAFVAELRSSGIQLNDSGPDLDNASDDFGRIARGRSLAVATPRSSADVVSIVRAAGNHGVGLTVRGGGLGQSGQSVAADTVTLDVSQLREPPRIEIVANVVRCGAAITFRELVETCAPLRVMPRVMPLNLDLTVGGVLSAGGIGATSHRYGLVAATVETVDVVTGSPDLVTASSHVEPELFAGVLGGLGRCGVITGAALQLRPARSAVRTSYLLYDDVEQWLADQRAIVERGGADYLESFCSAAVQGLARVGDNRRPFARWFYGLQVTVETDGGDAESDNTGLLHGLAPYQHLRTDGDTIDGFAARYDARFAGMRGTGDWERPHPWFECLVPASSLSSVLPEVLAALPLSLGDGHRVFWLGGDPARWPSLIARPDVEEVCTLAVLPTGVPHSMLPGVLDSLGAVWELLRSAGAKRYLSGYLGTVDDAWWREHHGANYERWCAAKRQYDPRHVFASLLFPR